MCFRNQRGLTAGCNADYFGVPGLSKDQNSPSLCAFLLHDPVDSGNKRTGCIQNGTAFLFQKGVILRRNAVGANDDPGTVGDFLQVIYGNDAFFPQVLNHMTVVNQRTGGIQ